MSGEVISMEDFQEAIVKEVTETPATAQEQAQEDWDWAVDKSFECITEAQGTQKIEMLISNLADDLIRISAEICGEKYPVTQLYDAISRGIDMDHGACDTCSGK